jgi:signal transduction histidine kinase
MKPELCSIEEILAGVAVSFNRSDGRLILTNDCPCNTKAMVDLTLFLAAIKNLVKNGFAYNDAVDKFVEIKASVQDRQILFSIIDNGVGFPAEYLESWGQVQGQAARLDPTKEGSGTGLYSVRRIIEAHKDATVTIVSQQGVGSTFLIHVGLEN